MYLTHRASRFLASTLLFVTAAAHADVCAGIVGAEAVREAGKTGFQFSAELKSGNGQCHILREAGSLLAVPSDASVELVCEARYFSGMTLREGWKMARTPRFRGPLFQYANDGLPKYDTANPAFTVRIKAQGGMKLLELTTISLEGPDCGDWKAAFGGS